MNYLVELWLTLLPLERVAAVLLSLYLLGSGVVLTGYLFIYFLGDDDG